MPIILAGRKSERETIKKIKLGILCPICNNDEFNIHYYVGRGNIFFIPVTRKHITQIFVECRNCKQNFELKEDNFYEAVNSKKKETTKEIKEMIKKLEDMYWEADDKRKEEEEKKVWGK